MSSKKKVGTLNVATGVTTFTKEQLRPKRKRPVSSKSLKPFQDRLRELGFKRDWEEASIYNGVTQHYVRTVPACGVQVKVMLCVRPDGKHSHNATHAHQYRSETHIGPADEYTHEDTLPVSFSSVDGMVEAINFETDRDVKRATIDKNFTKDFK